jgi:hypothetical protein
MDFTFNNIAAEVQQLSPRAAVVRDSLKKLQGRMNDSTFELADLLAEALENNYPTQLGFADLNAWLEDAELDIRQRQAEQLVQIKYRSEALGIPRETLRHLATGKLKAIFSLDVDRHFGGDKAKYEAAVRGLVEEAPNTKLDALESKVRQQKGIEEEGTVLRSYRMSEEGYENEVKPAIERVKGLAGQEMSDGAALIEICSDFNAGPDSI